jgi:60 kDa SS-A/Ro ribonucleoprotein
MEDLTMANKTIFAAAVPADVTCNNAGGLSYAMGAEAALAQYVMTGTFNSTFYADAKADTARVVDLARQVAPEFLAKLAVFAREAGYMKDAPAVMLAVLSTRSVDLFRQAFPRVIDNGKMLRTFVQIVRSGVAGRKSLGSAPKRMIAGFLASASDSMLINAVGQDPSLADVIRLARPKSGDASREAAFGYFIGKVAANDARLPEAIRRLEAFRADESLEVPKVDFRLLDSLPLSAENWKEIAHNAPWHATRMNLNSFARRGVFEDAVLTRAIADRLRDRDLIARSKAFPYQLLAAYLNIDPAVPRMVAEALIDAAEAATENVPAFVGRVFVFPDVSGSMRSPATGFRRGATSKVRCVDVAALVAAAILRKNPEAEVIPFEGQVVSLRLSPRDSLLTNAEKLAAVGGGSTACSAPLRLLNDRKAKGDLLVYVSDNESWLDSGRNMRTETEAQWSVFSKRNPEAKLACVDITPNATTQVRPRPNVLNVGGFSDAVFDTLAAFASGDLAGDGLVARVNRVVL